MSELSMVYDSLQKARCPEDVFGSSIKTSFRRLLRAVHPDRNQGALPTANKATELLNQLKDVADKRVENGTWGLRLPLPAYEVVVLGEVYTVARKPVVGDIADLFFNETAVVKIARSADDNDLMRAERSALELLDKKVTTVVRAGFPHLLGNFIEGKREANVLERLPQGFVTLQEIHNRMPVVDGRALVWIFKRLLMVLDWTHHYNLVHGAILPQHVLLYPDNDGTTTNPHPYKHTIRLVDWCYSIKYEERTRLSSWCPAWKTHYAPELIAKKSVGPTSDLYMAAMLISYLGDSAVIPGPLWSVLSRCLDHDIKRRYQTVTEVFEAWQKAAKVVYGAPKWVDFNLPNDAA